MLFAISYENFLLHMIDYFTKKEILNIEYHIVSAGVKNYGTFDNITKDSGILYPCSVAIVEYHTTGDLAKFRSDYLNDLNNINHGADQYIYVNFLQKILKYNRNIIIMYLNAEKYFIEILIDYIGKKFAMPCIDLDTLFIKGETSIFKINRSKVHNLTVPLVRHAKKIQQMTDESTMLGRQRLIKLMTRKAKFKKFKELGYNIRDGQYTNQELDEMLLDAWNE